MFKKCMIAWAVILGLGALALGRHDSTPTVKPVAATPAKPMQQKLSPVEECANLQLMIDRSLSVGQAFRICEMPPEKQAETWLKTRSYNQQWR
jgi:hypothetical protein